MSRSINVLYVGFFCIIGNMQPLSLTCSSSCNSFSHSGISFSVVSLGLFLSIFFSLFDSGENIFLLSFLSLDLFTPICSRSSLLSSTQQV